MTEPEEFHYRMPGRVGGWLPGAHAGSSSGTGQEFATHTSLYDRADPRRLDLRASLRSLRREWLVRVNRQRAGIRVHALVDVSASMSFGSRRSKLSVVADFLESLGRSAFRAGDALGMLAFDERERRDLYVPAHLSRGNGSLMAELIRHCEPGGRGVAGLQETVLHIAGRQGLVFFLSDFHWPLEEAVTALELLAPATVIPMVVWDPAETQPPRQSGLAPLRDLESGAHEMLWLRPKYRARWLEAARERRAEIMAFFARRDMRPFFMEGAFDAESLSRYFYEAAA